MVCNLKTEKHLLDVCVLVIPEIYLGLERTVQSVQENTVSVQVCVILSDYANVSLVSRRSCPVEFRTAVEITTSGGSAGSKLRFRYIHV